MGDGEWRQYPNCCEPIPLTEEWLLKFGFEKSGGGLYLTYETFEMYYINGVLGLSARVSDPNEGYIDTKIKYVHQLQNLHFALTGEELTIKEPAI